MKIALLNVVNKKRKEAMNKDLAGGMGTASSFGRSFLARILTFIKGKTIRLPIISFAFLQAILKEKGHEVEYFESDNLKESFDLVMIYGSIVDFRNELDIARDIKAKNPRTKVGFFGTFPTVSPETFKEADFVIKGEAESFFLYEFDKTEDLSGIIEVKKSFDLNDLPTPDFAGFPVGEYSYFPALRERPFLVLQASKGCPYTCHYYCPYGMIQGQNYRFRSAEKLIRDVETLIAKYGVKGIQFRDPTFGIDKNQVKDFCKGLIDKKIDIKFGIETRLDLLNKDILDFMFKAGLRNINVGIETSEEDVAKMNNRKLIQINHQEEIINYCKRLGIKISAFYIFGLQGDTEESVRKTIDYAVKLNTNVAQFTISCPYPGTKYYDELNSKNLIIENDFEKFNANNVVFKHENLSREQLLWLQDLAFRKYYFRPRYFLNLLQ